MPFLRECMRNSRNETFLAINLAEMESEGKIPPKDLELLLKYFKLVVDQELQIKVFFNHIDLRVARQEIDRVISLAEDNNLLLKNDELMNRWCPRGEWKLRDMSEVVKPKRQRELITFVKGLIVRDHQQLPAERQEIDDIVDSFFEENSEMSLSIGRERPSEQKSKAEEKGRMGWWAEAFVAPKLREIGEEDKAYILGSRRRDLEKTFE
jgi:hypothetical protein